MGDYLEEILDYNDLEMDILAALDEGMMLNEHQFEDLCIETGRFDEVDADKFYAA
ncbi:hypothetical protein [Kaarinaea lacus]